MKFCKRNMFIYNDIKGSIYLMALVTMTVIFMVLMVFVQKLQFEIRVIKDSISNVRVQNIASSGLEDAVYELRNFVPGNRFEAIRNWSVSGNAYVKSFPQAGSYQGTYNVTIEPIMVVNDTSNTPVTFNVEVVGELLADNEIVSRKVVADCKWMRSSNNKIYITDYRKQ
jgi:hypothetical protein